MRQSYLVLLMVTATVVFYNSIIIALIPSGIVAVYQNYAYATASTEEEENIRPRRAEIAESTSTFSVYGFIGKSLTRQDADRGTGYAPESYIAAGRWRILRDESLIHRFVAKMYLESIDGISSHNVTIEETFPHRFKIMPGANGTTGAAPAAGSFPPFSSNIAARIFIDSNVSAIDDVPLTVSIRGQVLAIQSINIDESRVGDNKALDVLRIIQGQTIYGTISR